jgi:hypothetical protein
MRKRLKMAERKGTHCIKFTKRRHENFLETQLIYLVGTIHCVCAQDIKSQIEAGISNAFIYALAVSA